VVAERTVEARSGRNLRLSPAAVTAVLWILAAAVYVGGEAIAASVFPGYSYATNYISDLGAPVVGSYQGRAVDSPLHAVMNTAFVVKGLLYLAAALVVTRAVPAGARRHVVTVLFIVFAGIHCIGVSLVGFVPETTPLPAGSLHVVGAGMAIVGGNLALIAGGIGSRHIGASRAYIVVSVALGVIGIAALAMLMADGGSVDFDILPDGVWERAAVYTITVWEVLTGVLLLSSLGRARSLSER